jgi:protein arginine kinase activator
MQCQICANKTATIHLTEITNGVRTELHFCEQCAIEQGIAAHGQVSVNELLGNLLSSAPTDDELAGRADSETVCPECGFKLSQFRKEIVLGCPNDYTVFEKELLPLIANAHNGKTAHCGKVPARIPQDMKVKIEYSNLKEQLQAAVQREEYEKAAQLRDKIKHLEQN